MGNKLQFFCSAILVLLLTSFINKGFGQYDTVSYNITFQTLQPQSMWENPGFHIDFEKELFDIGWNASGGWDGIKTILNQDFGLGFDAGSRGKMGMGFYLNDLTSGRIDTVVYPVGVNFVVPETKSFNAGQTIRINSFFEVGDDVKLVTTYPNGGRAGLKFNFFMNNYISMDACFIDCKGTTLNLNIPNIDRPLFQVSTIPGETFYPGFAPPPNLGFACYEPPAVIPTMKYRDILPLTIEKELSKVRVKDGDTIVDSSPFFSGELDLPLVQDIISTTAPGNTLLASGEDTYITAAFDVIGTLFSYAPQYKLKNELSIPGIDCFATIGYNIFSTDIVFSATNKQEFEFTGKVEAKLELPSRVEYQIIRPPGTIIAMGNDSIIYYRIGDILEFKFPCTYEYLDLKPLFSLRNKFTNHTYDNYGVRVDLSALEFSITFEKYVLVPAMKICLPIFGCDSTPEVAFDPPDVQLGPLWEDSYPIGSVNLDWYKESWELDHFNTISSPTFRIEPKRFTIDLEPNTILCHGAATGNILLSDTGASAPLKYNWSNGSSARNLENVKAGEYYVKVTDVNGCEALGGARILEPPEMFLTGQKTNCLCHGDATGGITLEVEGGIPPYIFNWSNGATTKDLSNIPAGEYMITVRDQNGCTISDTFLIEQPTPLLSYFNDHGMPLCNGDNNGYIKINSKGGTPPYRYHWSTFEVTQNIDSLVADNYSVEITDDNDCSVEISMYLPEPPLLTGNINIEQEVSCYKGDDGILQLDLTGGTKPYEITWFGPEYTFEDTSTRLTNLKEGLYQIEIYDSNFCFFRDTIVLPAPREPFYATLDEKHLSCANGNDGQIILTVHNGTPPYSYAWSNGNTTKDVSDVPAGKYEAYITDNLGCKTHVNTILLEPREIYVIADIEPVSCIDESDGVITLAPGGGYPPYAINWDTGESGDSIGSLPGGMYSATIVDNNECVEYFDFEMTVRNVGCIYIPSAFTPNGDGYNDQWIIRNLNLYPDNKIQVFTKWGELIYSAAGNAEPWDGTRNGQALPSATYYYVVDIGNGDPLRKGLVTIVR